MTACPAALNGLRLRTSAGRGFAPGRSLNGNGTATTSQASQVTERLVVLLARPLVHGLRERHVECRVEGLATRHVHHVSFHLVADEVTRDGPKAREAAKRRVRASTAGAPGGSRARLC